MASARAPTVQVPFPSWSNSRRRVGSDAALAQERKLALARCRYNGLRTLGTTLGSRALPRIRT